MGCLSKGGHQQPSVSKGRLSSQGARHETSAYSSGSSQPYGEAGKLLLSHLQGRQSAPLCIIKAARQQHPLTAGPDSHVTQHICAALGQHSCHTCRMMHVTLQHNRGSEEHRCSGSRYIVSISKLVVKPIRTKNSCFTHTQAIQRQHMSHDQVLQWGFDTR